MRTAIPSLSALRAFEAAARHRSFTRAANELHRTQAAVSQQVSGLERHLGVKLFVRQQGESIPTAAAERYLVAVRSAIDSLASATEDLVTREDDQVLAINSLATFAFKVLVPRLGDFRAECPDILLRVSASTSFDEFRRNSHDVSICLGSGAWPGMRVDRLFDDVVFPVCSPALVERLPLRKPPDLKNHVLIRSGVSFLIADAWPTWLSAANLQSIEAANELSFEFAFAALEAAAQGLGVALGREPFVHDDISHGRLIKPFEIEASTGRAYYLVSPLEIANRPKVKKFRDWLLSLFARKCEWSPLRHEITN
jgi:LysR family transcriptional regulator, glycine cleavage system transcriptional activator